VTITSAEDAALGSCPFGTPGPPGSARALPAELLISIINTAIVGPRRRTAVSFQSRDVIMPMRCDAERSDHPAR